MDILLLNLFSMSMNYSLKPRSDRARRRASTRSHLAYFHPAVNYVIFSYVIALSITSLAQVLSGGV